MYKCQYLYQHLSLLPVLPVFYHSSISPVKSKCTAIYNSHRIFTIRAKCKKAERNMIYMKEI